MTAKATVDGEESQVDTMIERIRVAQEEPWRKLRYVDEESSEAWNKFEELFVDIEHARAKPGGVGLGKERENADVEEMGIPKLESSMTNTHYVDAISAPREEMKLKKKRVRKPKKHSGEGNDGFASSITLSDDDDDDVVMET